MKTLRKESSYLSLDDITSLAVLSKEPPPRSLFVLPENALNSAHHRNIQVILQVC
jgi:hypothetical protein